ncbi:PQQ-binding-like beta-propeller repeat protein, partial [Salmonella enterica subsp. enterica serovar Minnesota]|uniref:outer membrane protein assembly factor BamB family protein n=1 Tax=Salmonella enterica TaxID=28901 RepID=UPI003D2E9767
DRDRGAEVWRVRVDSGAPARVPPDQKDTRWDRYGSSVVADSNTLYYAGRDRYLYALDLETGRERWRVAADDLMTATPAL